MKRIYKIMRDKKGEGYIDAAVVVFCVMFVIALGVRIFPVFITKIQLDNFADELVREAEISGRVGSETTARQRTLEEKTGIHPAVSWSGTGKIQLTDVAERPRTFWEIKVVPGNHKGEGIGKE